MAPGERTGGEIPASHVPESRITKGVALTLALACACAFLVLPMLSPAASDNTRGHGALNPPGISVVEKTIPAPADARMAEIKAIRDLREAAAYSHAADPLLQNDAKRPLSSPADGIRKAVKGAATLVSKTFQKIASEL